MSDLETTLALLIEDAGLPLPKREHRFARDIVGEGPGLRKRLAAACLRDWRFDFAWTEQRLAVECEGGIWSKGRHVRGQGFEEDCRKYAAAQLHGWRVLRVTRGMIEDGTALATVSQMLAEMVCTLDHCDLTPVDICGKMTP